MAKAPSTRRREILLPEGTPPQQVRRMRSENRATLVASIARGRRWLNELITHAKASAESIAKREGCSTRKVNMTFSLAFLAPDLVKAAIEGKLARGMGVTRLTDLPAEWSQQYEMFGLPSHGPDIYAARKFRGTNAGARSMCSCLPGRDTEFEELGAAFLD